MRALWCDQEVVTAWRRFIEAVHGKDVPTDVLETMIKLDHAILTEELQRRMRDPVQAGKLSRRRRALRGG